MKARPLFELLCMGRVTRTMSVALLLTTAVSTAVHGQSHKDNVRCTAVDEQFEQLEAKEIRHSQPSSTSLLMISSGPA